MVTVWARIGAAAMAIPTRAAASVFAIAFIVSLRAFGNRAPPDSGEGRINSISYCYSYKRLTMRQRRRRIAKICTLIEHLRDYRSGSNPAPGHQHRVNLTWAVRC